MDCIADKFDPRMRAAFKEWVERGNYREEVQRVERFRRVMDLAEQEGADSEVYIIEAVGSYRVKIGFTKDVRSRIERMQTGCPFTLEVLATLRGGRQVEKHLHERFAKARIHYEWFHYDPMIADFVYKLNNPPGIPECEEC